MAMGRRKRKKRQRSLFVPHTATQGPRHRFYEALEALLRQANFDEEVELLCEPYYDPDQSKGRRSIPPGVYFRMLLIGYFEGIESERGICWRCEDSLSLKAFLGYEIDERTVGITRRQRLPCRSTQGRQDAPGPQSRACSGHANRCDHSRRPPRSHSWRCVHDRRQPRCCR